jgi:RES domain-containing protein
MVKQKKASRNAFDGEGARLYGGRWNSPGFPMVYTAGSQSLAVLEMLVHLDNSGLLEKYVFIEVTLDDAMVTVVAAADLLRDWRADPAPLQLRAIGDDWVASGASVVLRVPSSVIPAENNYLLNPKHADFAKLKFGKAVSFRYDSRLAERG